MRAALIILALILAIYGVRKMTQNKDVLILARTIYGEARGEGERGMQIVANIVMNRVAEETWYGDGVQGVCLKDKQFSCWNIGDPNRAKIINIEPGDNSVFDLAYDIAARAVAGELPDLTSGGNHYHTKSINPYWAKSMAVAGSYGDHIFYKA